MNKETLGLRGIISKLSNLNSQTKRYRLVAFVLFVAVLYGFLAYKISSLGNTEPSADAVNSQVRAAQIPRIDKRVVSQLQSLQDNSVNVQTLFSQARSNPFQ